MPTAIRNLIAYAVLMLTVAMIVATIISAAAGCSSVRDASREVASDVVDCTTVHVHEHASQYGALLEAALLAATQLDGSVDWAPIRTVAKSFAAETGGCVLAGVVQRALAPRPPPATVLPQVAPLVPNPASVRAGFDELRREQFNGRRFRTDLGVL
ncbi:MAG TPA: hypothetical protein VN253_03025 [Kofleriaceae bacterium]|nr:hypothetical protein [Kofleriaceae bacterium]